MKEEYRSSDAQRQARRRGRADRQTAGQLQRGIKDYVKSRAVIPLPPETPSLPRLLPRKKDEVVSSERQEPISTEREVAIFIANQVFDDSPLQVDETEVKGFDDCW